MTLPFRKEWSAVKGGRTGRGMFSRACGDWKAVRIAGNRASGGGMTRFAIVASSAIRQSSGQVLGGVSDQGCQIREK